MLKDSIAIVIPALNEEDALHDLLPEIMGPLASWIIVVDNNSTDGTALVAEQMGAIVLRECVRGYGRACWRGFLSAQELGAEIIVFLDGDGSDNPIDLPQMLAPILEDRADIVIGSRIGVLAEPGAVPLQARLGNWLVSCLLNFIYGTDIHDVGSFRVLRIRALETLQMQEMQFGWPVEMLVKAARAHYRICEVPLHYRRRSHGRSKVAGTAVGSIRAAYAMVSTLVRYACERKMTYV